MQKFIQQQKRNAGAKLFKKKTVEWDFYNLEISIFFNFLNCLFLLVWVIKNILIKKDGVNGLVLKIDAIDGKKWVKFVAMQQNSAILIYDFNRMKVKERFLKKGPFKTGQFHAPEKSHLVLKVSKKAQKTILSHFKDRTDFVCLTNTYIAWRDNSYKYAVIFTLHSRQSANLNKWKISEIIKK